MPQGNKIKIKTKGGKPPPQKGKPAKKPAGVKKGKLVFAPRKMHHQDVYKFKKNVQKCINANIEKEMKEKAQTCLSQAIQHFKQGSWSPWWQD